MAPAISIDRAKLAAICRRHHIRILSLFGSILRSDFRSDSDVDVLVEFEPGKVPGFLKLFEIEAQPADDVYVGHMLDLVRKIVAKTGRISRDEFDRDENLRLALAHLLQTIGEATRRVSRELQAQHPEIPWPAIIGMRHKVVDD